MKRKLILHQGRKRIIVDDVHKGLRSNQKAKALAAHSGHEYTFQKLAKQR